MKKTTEKDSTGISSDEFVSQSGVQGGKIIGEHLALGCVLLGAPFFIIGLYAAITMVFGLGYPTNTAIIIGVVLVMIIGLLLIVSGYFLYSAKRLQNH